MEYSLQRSPVPEFSAESFAAEDDLAKHSGTLSGVVPSSETSNSQKSPFNSTNLFWWQGSSFQGVTNSKHVYGPIATPMAIDNMLEEVDAQFNDTKVKLQNHSCTFTDKSNLGQYSSNINQGGTSFSGVEFHTDDSFIALSAQSPCSSSLQLTLKSPSYTPSHIKTSPIESSASRSYNPTSPSHINVSLPSNSPVSPSNSPVPPSNSPVPPSNSPVSQSNSPVSPTNSPISSSYNPTSPSHINLSLPSNSPVSPSNSPISPNYSPVSPTSPGYSSTPRGCFSPSPVYSASPAYSPSREYSLISSQYEQSAITPSTSFFRCSLNKTPMSKSIFSIHMNKRFRCPRRPWQTKQWKRKKIRI